MARKSKNINYVFGVSKSLLNEKYLGNTKGVELSFKLYFKSFHLGIINNRR